MDYYNPNDYDEGDYVKDMVGLGGKTLDDVSFGVAYKGYDPVGVLGISFTFEEMGRMDPTVLDLMKQQGLIDRKAYSLFLNSLDTAAGSILFGGIDTSRYSGNLISLPLQRDYTRNITDLSVALTSVSITDASGKTTPILPPARPGSTTPATFDPVPACLDSGTWDLELPVSIADSIVSGMGGTFTVADGYVVPCFLCPNARRLAVLHLRVRRRRWRKDQSPAPPAHDRRRLPLQGRPRSLQSRHRPDRHRSRRHRVTRGLVPPQCICGLRPGKFRDRDGAGCL